MKVLGFVNRHSRGVLRVQKELKANENGEAVYDFSYQTAVMVKENKSLRADRMIKEAIDNGLLMENGEKRSQKGSEKRSGLTISEEKQTQKPSNLEENAEVKTQKPSNLKENDERKMPQPTISDFPSILVWNVYEAIRQNRKAK